MTRLSARTAWAREPNTLARLLAEARASGRPLIDLTASNPSKCGLAQPELMALFGDPSAAVYEPEAAGLLAARSEVSRHYTESGHELSPSRVVLSASTSESYGWLFKLLCDPGEAVLVPSPSYPLLAHLAQLEAVELRHYPLIRQERWRIDVGEVARELARGDVRAVVLVHPNNPTGSLVRQGDAEALAGLCATHGAALVVDEVFLEYRDLGEPADPRSMASFVGLPGVCCFVLGGLSKLALLPQVKLGWIVVSGPADEVAEVMPRLELVADTYLSVAAGVQHALGAILAAAPAVQARLRARLSANLAALDAAIAAQGDGCPVRRLPVQAGWYVLLEVPRTRDDDAWLAAALEEGVVLHPGYFFDVREAGTMVLSLLPEPEVFARGVARAVALFAGS